MKAETTIKATGFFTISILRKGKVIPVCKRKPNLVLNGLFNNSGGFDQISEFATFTDTTPNHEDLNGTWSQSGNTITRATGSGTFPTSPSQIGNELLWETGERCHVTARASDTSITVSGPARSITGLRLRRFRTNLTWSSGSSQTSGSTADALVQDRTTGIYSQTIRATFASAVSGYTLGSIAAPTRCRVVLDTPVAIEAEDQLQVEYTFEFTATDRLRIYELGAEAVGIPKKYAVVSIVGSGTAVDVTFSGPTNFLAGDKLDLRTVTPKKFAISSASSNSTTFTVNTTLAHGLIVGDTVVIEGASLAGYNGTHTVATVPDTDTITITNAANPGALGASGTLRLATPATYFDDLGLATIASMVSSSVARITSTITGPAADTASIGGDPGVNQTFFGGMTGVLFATTEGSTDAFYVLEANAVAIPAVSDTTYINPTKTLASLKAYTAASFGNDWTRSLLLTWNAGAGTNASRIKQVAARQSSGAPTVAFGALFTFNTPVPKETTERLRFTYAMQCFRELTPSTFP